MKKIFTVMIIMSLAVFSLVFLASCQSSPSQKSFFDRSKITVQDAKDVTLGDIKWKLIEVEDLGTQITGSEGLVYPATQGKFIFIDFSVENIGSEEKILYDLRVIDNKGRIYSICNQAYGYLGSNYSACSLVPIIPGVKANNYSAAFDVDLDSKGLVIEFTDLNLPPKETAYINLGL